MPFARRRQPVVLPVLNMEWALHREIYFGIRHFVLQRRSNGCGMLGVLRVESLRRALREVQPDGIVAGIGSLDLLRRIRQTAIPFVNVSNRLIPPPTPAVLVDERATGRMVAEYFLRRGFRRFAFCGFANHNYSVERKAGFADALRAAGFECACFDQRLGEGPNEAARLTVGVKPWLLQLPRPVAIMACNDFRASQVVGACMQLGIRVPNEVAVVGVDNDDLFCLLAETPLSSVAVPADQIGYRAAALLLDQLSGRADSRTILRVAPREVVTRQSSDILAVADPVVARAMRLIQTQAHRPLYVAEVAAAVGVSQRGLERRFETALGYSPSSAITQSRLDRACQLLVGTDCSIGEVAEASGFGQARELTANFRKRLGMPPSAYRRQFRMR